MKFKFFSQVLIYSILCVSVSFSQTKKAGSKKTKKNTEVAPDKKKEDTQNNKASVSEAEEEDTQKNKKKAPVKHELDPKEEKKMADNYFLHESYKLALPLYLELYKSDADNPELNYRLGICYLHTISKSNSIFYLEKAQKLDINGKYQDIEHFLGIAYQAKHDFDKAIHHYEVYKGKLNPKLEHDAEALYETNRFLEQCKAGKKLSENPPKNVKIEHLGPKVNSPYSESFPLITPDEKVLYFASNRNNSTGGRLDRYTKEYFEDIYYSVKVNGEWTAAQHLKGPVNTNTHDVPLSVSYDGKKMFVSNSDDVNAGDIFLSNFSSADTSWSKPEDLGEVINSDEWESSACIAPDGKTLYFTSEREDGMGGSDIYKTHLQESGEWSDPVNLGAPINTPYNEESPFLMDNGRKLCFSSQGHLNMGGYDIFTSIHNPATNKWSEPENLGYPINSAGDEVHITWSADGKRGYYAINRENNYGDEDIYVIHLDDNWEPALLPERKKVHITKVNSKIEGYTRKPRNKNTSAGKDSLTASNKSNQAIIDKKTNTDNSITAQTDSAGKNSNTPILPDKTKTTAKADTVKGTEIVKNTDTQKEKTKNVSDSKELSGKHKKEKDLAETALVSTAERPIEVPPSLAGMHEKTNRKPNVGEIFNEKVHWGYNGSSYITEYSRHKLESVIEVLKKYPDLKIEIDGYTDDMGSEEYNNQISLKRAKTVYNYLTENGIDSSRLSYKGLGITNMVVKKPSVSEAVKNRRAEFKVVNKIEPSENKN